MRELPRLLLVLAIAAPGCAHRTARQDAGAVHLHPVHVDPVRLAPVRLDPVRLAQLASADAGQRADAAFALGQLGLPWDPAPLSLQLEAEARLLERHGQERDASVREQLVAALGRVGRAASRRALLAELSRPGPARTRAGWALAHLYRRLRDQLDASVDVAALARLLDEPDAALRAAVTDSLAELRRPAASPALVRALADPAPLVRARAARGLIELARPDEVPALERALADPDERVASAAALALAQLAERGIAPVLAADTLSRNLDRLSRPAVLIALSEAGLLRAELGPLFERLVERLSAPSVGAPRLACAAALGHDRILGRVDRVRLCGGPAIAEPARSLLAVRVLAETAPGRAKDGVETLLMLASDAAPVRAAVATALGRHDEARAQARLLELSTDADPIVWSAAAEGAAQHRLLPAGPRLIAHLPHPDASGHLAVGADDVEPLLSLSAALAILKPAGAAAALRPLLEGTPRAVALAAREALAVLGVQAPAHPSPARGPFDELPLEGAPVVQLDTDRGSIRLRLRVDRAPRTARNFVGLARRGFYDGLSFHRVVPGFVAQGGDPRGDGSGSAGHLISCEPNALPYVEGTVGMALSGLDTGSSQFFIALAPAPHLEGRYTAFAEVISGMDVARALQPGDTILRAFVE